MNESRPTGVQRPSALPSATRKPRVVLGVFWLLVAALCVAATVGGLWWGALLAIGCVAYSVYLFRGGRYGFWFI